MHIIVGYRKPPTRIVRSADKADGEGEEEGRSHKETEMCYDEIGLTTMRSILTSPNLPQVLGHVDLFAKKLFALTGCKPNSTGRAVAWKTTRN